jgi:hypothetical protein
MAFLIPNAIKYCLWTKPTRFTKAASETFGAEQYSLRWKNPANGLAKLADCCFNGREQLPPIDPHHV